MRGHADELNEKAKAKRPVRLKIERAWREKNPLKVAAIKRRHRLAGTHGYASRERYLAARKKQQTGPPGFDGQMCK